MVRAFAGLRAGASGSFEARRGSRGGRTGQEAFRFDSACRRSCLRLACHTLCTCLRSASTSALTARCARGACPGLAHAHRLLWSAASGSKRLHGRLIDWSPMNVGKYPASTLVPGPWCAQSACTALNCCISSKRDLLDCGIQWRATISMPHWLGTYTCVGHTVTQDLDARSQGHTSNIKSAMNRWPWRSSVHRVQCRWTSTIGRLRCSVHAHSRPGSQAMTLWRPPYCHEI